LSGLIGRHSCGIEERFGLLERDKNDKTWMWRAGKGT
jgi:hypothetical protein